MERDQINSKKSCEKLIPRICLFASPPVTIVKSVWQPIYLLQKGLFSASFNLVCQFFISMATNWNSPIFATWPACPVWTQSSLWSQSQLCWRRPRWRSRLRTGRGRRSSPPSCSRWSAAWTCSRSSGLRRPSAMIDLRQPSAKLESVFTYATKHVLNKQLIFTWQTCCRTRSSQTGSGIKEFQMWGCERRRRWQCWRMAVDYWRMREWTGVGATGGGCFALSALLSSQLTQLNSCQHSAFPAPLSYAPEFREKLFGRSTRLVNLDFLVHGPKLFFQLWVEEWTAASIGFPLPLWWEAPAASKALILQIQLLLSDRVTYGGGMPWPAALQQVGTQEDWDREQTRCLGHLCYI